ncbi:MAG: amidohydrolase [Candidatus Kapaibacteriales bacterium]
MFQGYIKIRNNRIVDVISKEGLLIIDLDGKINDFGNAFAYPGFADSHVHLLWGGELLLMTNVRDCSSELEVVKKIYNKPFYRGDWIYVRGWDNSNWTSKNFPNKNLLDSFFPNIPVCLVRNDGHCIWVNSKALDICHISKNTPDPQGGLIVRDKNGQPTGILIDKAVELVTSNIPKHSEKDILSFIKISVEYFAKHGITEIDDMDVDPKTLPIYESYFSSDLPNIEVNIFLHYDKNILENLSHLKKYENEFISIVGFKLFMDGALGSYGALLSNPYNDRPNFIGLQLYNKSELREIFEMALNYKIGIAIHSIGDLATKIILEVYEELVKDKKATLPFLRIEHSQLVDASDLKKFKKLKVIPSVQPIHFLADFEMAKLRLGQRKILAYPWNSFLQNQIPFCSGSDFPIETANPLKGINILVNRDKINNYNFFGREQITIEEAIYSYTKFHSLSLDKIPNSIHIGSKANITILKNNLLTIDKDKITETQILCTIVNGKIIYHC